MCWFFLELQIFYMEKRKGMCNCCWQGTHMIFWYIHYSLNWVNKSYFGSKMLEQITAKSDQFFAGTLLHNKKIPLFTQIVSLSSIPPWQWDLNYFRPFSLFNKKCTLWVFGFGFGSKNMSLKPLFYIDRYNFCCVFICLLCFFSLFWSNAGIPQVMLRKHQGWYESSKKHTCKINGLIHALCIYKLNPSNADLIVF